MSEERPIILELDCATGIQTERPMTDEEYEHYQAMQERNAVQQAELQAQLEKEQADKASGRAKLAALGLSDDEITAMIGAEPPEGETAIGASVSA